MFDAFVTEGYDDLGCEESSQFIEQLIHFFPWRLV